MLHASFPHAPWWEGARRTRAERRHTAPRARPERKHGSSAPSERGRIPRCVLEYFTSSIQREMEAPPPTTRVCRGTILSRQQYLVDVEQWKFRDVRQLPENPMTGDQIAEWTAGIAVDG